VLFRSAGGLSATQLSIVLALGSVTRLLTSPASARLADGWGLRAVLVSGAALAALTLPAMALLQGFAMLLLVQLVHSVGVAPVVPVSDAAAIAVHSRCCRESGLHCPRDPKVYGLVKARTSKHVHCIPV
jgi:MFS family permease